MLRLFALLALLLAAPAQAARLTGLTITSGTVSISADGRPAVAHQLALGAPYRLVIDIPAVTEPMTMAGAGSVTRMRLAMYSPGVARLVLDLAAPLEIVSAQSHPAGLTLKLRRIDSARFAESVSRGRRPLPIDPLASDFELPETLTGAPPATPAGAVAMPGPTKTEPAKTDSVKPTRLAEEISVPAAGAVGPQVAVKTDAPSLAISAEGPPPPIPRAAGIKPRAGTKPRVVIDAGHGGKDVGAISVNGGYEKDVTLAIARATARRLERNGRVVVTLTRNDDRFIPLAGRVAIARKARADLFISIHADSAPNPQARGASVYTLSAVASDAVAARLAARENKADIIGGVNLGLEAPEVGDIMIDLSRRATGNVSVAFAEILQDELASRIKFRGEFHHFAGFLVLKAPDVPSVLLETGYVSNAEDSALLFADKGRNRIAEGIAAAIERHLLGD